MKNARHAALIAVCATVGFASHAKAADRCIAYGDEKTEYTWRLCPAGEKFERRYYYFGIWSDFYTVRSDIGACRWTATTSSWRCPDRTVRCNAERCGTS
jgi:hypothetical protein